MRDRSRNEEQWRAEREARFGALERLLRARARPDVSEAEVEADIEEAIAAVRAERRNQPIGTE